MLQRKSATAGTLELQTEEALLSSQQEPSATQGVAIGSSSCSPAPRRLLTTGSGISPHGGTQCRHLLLVGKVRVAPAVCGWKPWRPSLKWPSAVDADPMIREKSVVQENKVLG